MRGSASAHQKNLALRSTATPHRGTNMKMFNKNVSHSQNARAHGLQNMQTKNMEFCLKVKSSHHSVVFIFIRTFLHIVHRVSVYRMKIVVNVCIFYFFYFRIIFGEQRTIVDDSKYNKMI